VERIGERGLGVIVAGAALLLVIALLADAPTAVAAGCPNESRRVEQESTDLAGCRAYEMVTPPVKGSGEPQPIEFGETKEGHETAPLTPGRLLPAYGARAASDGDRMAWLSEPVPGAHAPGLTHLATRGPVGWESEDLVPPMSPLNGLVCPALLGMSAWSPDLTRSILDLPAGAPQGFKQEEECGHDEPRLVPGEPENFRNLFVHDNLGGANQLVNLTPAGVSWPEPEASGQNYWPASFLAGSDDLGHVVFEEELALTNDAPIGFPGGDELYESAGGQVKLVSLLPDGTPVHGVLAGATRNYEAESGLAGDKAINLAQFRHAVSTDGSRIFFEAEGALYLREDGGNTVQIDESTGPGNSGGGHFMVASADGSRVFFTDENRLTPDSTAEPGLSDLYEYDVDSGQLIDLTVDAVEPAGVLGVSGASEDGSYVYLVASGALTADANSHGDTPIAGEPNLYLSHDGVTSFVATLDLFKDECDWTQKANCAGGELGSGLTSRVSESGAFLGFNSVRDLTGYDNTDAATGEPDIEIYLYDAAVDQLSCASCDPSGARPTSGAAIKWPSMPGFGEKWHNAYPQHNVSTAGQVFFETSEALVPRDGNGRRDVYEYDDGQLHLLSTGTSEAGSHFLDATPDGSDVFFSTTQRLLHQDIDGLYDYYDARVGGGFPNPSSTSVRCEGESCRGPAAVPANGPSVGSATFVGPGNRRPAKCRKGTKRKHGKCVKSKHGHHKKQHRAKDHRRLERGHSGHGERGASR